MIKVGDYVIFNDAEHAKRHSKVFTFGHIYKVSKVEGNYVMFGAPESGVYDHRVLLIRNITELEKAIYGL